MTKITEMENYALIDLIVRYINTRSEKKTYQPLENGMTSRELPLTGRLERTKVHRFLFTHRHF